MPDPVDVVGALKSMRHDQSEPFAGADLVTRAMWTSRRRVRRRRLALATLGSVGVVVLVLVNLLSPPLPVVTAVPSTPPISTPDPASPGSESPTGARGVRLAGMRGNQSWGVWNARLWISTDAGRSFSQMPPPPDIGVDALRAVDVDDDGRVTLVAFESTTRFSLSRATSPSGGWTPGVTLETGWEEFPGTDVYTNAAVRIATIGRRVSVLALAPAGMTTMNARLFTSDDDGLTFRATSPTAMGVRFSLFWQGRSGITISAINRPRVDYTQDGGISWAESSLTGVDSTLNPWSEVLFQPERILIPLRLATGGFAYLISTDGGATFSQRTTGLNLTNPRGAADNQGNLWWVSDGAQLHRSADGGLTWTSTASTSEITHLQISDATTASALIALPGPCTPAVRVDCPSVAFARSTDAGATWVVTP